MEILDEIIVRKTNHSLLESVDWNHLEFGKYHTDHMLVCDYRRKAWEKPQILPFANLSLSPVTLALHYGQTVFEGMKAFRMTDGRINIFRPDKHYRRMVLSCERMCMPVIPEEIFQEGLRRFIELDHEWVPPGQDEALYIRPFMLATEARLGVKISDEYRFLIVAGPVGPYYQHPIRVKVETEYVRAAKGGTGYAKCGGNYGGAFYPTEKAREKGFDQVLWTDAAEHRYLEESGTTNIMLVLQGKLVTPPLSDSILDGVTRDSFLVLARDAGLAVEERNIGVDELEDACKSGRLSEAFCVGTAAVSTLISGIGIGNAEFRLEDPGTNGVAATLTKSLEKIRRGLAPDCFSWNRLVG
jgi:branched-chain amino acid aminotransferase